MLMRELSTWFCWVMFNAPKLSGRPSTVCTTSARLRSAITGYQLVTFGNCCCA